MGVVSNVIKDMANHGTEKLGLFLSVYRGFVLNNEDPNKQGCIKVIVPGIIDEETDYWVPSMGNYAGKGYGLHIMPSIGSIVYVMFELGDPSKPLWLHGYHGDGDIPKDYDSPGHYWFVTPGGASVEINDELREITLNDHHGNSIELNENGVSIDVKASKKKIYLGDINKADEPAVLGDTLESLLKDIIDNQVAINKLIRDVGEMITNTMIDIGASSLTNVKGPLMAAKATTMGLQLLKTYATLSSKNESIMARYNNLYKFKSTTVKLDK